MKYKIMGWLIILIIVIAAGIGAMLKDHTGNKQASGNRQKIDKPIEPDKYEDFKDDSF